MIKRHKILLTLAMLLLLILGYVFRPGQLDPRFYPSDSPAVIPDASLGFTDYVMNNRARVREALTKYNFTKETWPFGTAYPLERVVDMRAPYQIEPTGSDCSNQSTQGFLLIHGLSDSPWLLRSVAQTLSEQFSCALIRGLLSPGHGTVPGDLKTVRREDWAATVAWGVDSFADLADELYIVGYSNGAPLALQYLDQHRESKRITGLILLSPGLEVRDKLAPLSPYVGLLRPWVARHEDRDAAKYESFPMHAVAEFYRLTQSVTDAAFRPLDVPVMMVMSGNDTTVNPQAALDFFCSRVSGRRLGIWYESPPSDSAPPQTCSGLETHRLQNDDPRFVSYSHVAIAIPPDDPHYGKDGNYANCLAYAVGSENRDSCVQDPAATVYGENDLIDENGLYQGKLLRRASYNPDFDAMMEQVRCFILGTCGITADETD